VTIELGSELETRLAAMAQQSGKTPEEFALEVLRQRVLPRVWRDEPRDDFERLLREVGSPCGVSLSDEALSREEMYD